MHIPGVPIAPALLSSIQAFISGAKVRPLPVQLLLSGG